MRRSRRRRYLTRSDRRRVRALPRVARPAIVLWLGSIKGGSYLPQITRSLGCNACRAQIGAHSCSSRTRFGLPRSYGLTHRPNSIRSATGSLANVERILGGVLLPDPTEERIFACIRQRQDEGVCGPSIDLDLGELSRTIGRTCSDLWPKIRKLEERKDVGRALTPEQQRALLDAVDHMSRSMLERYSNVRMKAKRDAVAGSNCVRGSVFRRRSLCNRKSGDSVTCTCL